MLHINNAETYIGATVDNKRCGRQLLLINLLYKNFMQVHEVIPLDYNKKAFCRKADAEFYEDSGVLANIFFIGPILTFR